MNDYDKIWEAARAEREYWAEIQKEADELGKTPEMEDKYGPVVRDERHMCRVCGNMLEPDWEGCPYCQEEEDRKADRDMQQDIERERHALGRLRGGVTRIGRRGRGKGILGGR